MKIYYIWREKEQYSETYDSMVVVAKSKKDALKIHPCEEDKNWAFCKDGLPRYGYDRWVDGTVIEEWGDGSQGWVNFNNTKDLKITQIGVACKKQGRGVIVASYNEGLP